MVYLDSEIHPLHFPEGLEGRIVVTEERKNELEGKLSKLHVYDTGSKLLVSFVHEGLAIIHEGEVTFLNGTGVMLSSVLPDNSILYLNHNFPEGPQLLRRAVIRRDGLDTVWERNIANLPLHHWGEVFEGKLYQPGRDFVTIPNAMSRAIGFTYGNCVVEDARSDSIRVFDVETGEYEKSIPLLPIIASQEGEGGEALRKSIRECGDPLHFNTIRVLKTAEQAKYFPGGKIGDMLISTRNNNAIFLLDEDTLNVKWYVIDEFEQQHDPVITDRGTLLVFDNLGSDKANGESRIVEIDISSKRVLGIHEATGNDYFGSPVRGKLSIVDGKILVQEQGTEDTGHDATLFTLDCPQGFVSPACKKAYIFRADSPAFTYENAFILPSD
jgi:hypothetical protein